MVLGCGSEVLISVSLLRSRISCEKVYKMMVHTGKTTGTPPRTGLDPSNLAAVLSQRFSRPLASLQEITLAPKRRTSTDSPVGSFAVTLSPETSTVA